MSHSRAVVNHPNTIKLVLTLTLFLSTSCIDVWARRTQPSRPSHVATGPNFSKHEQAMLFAKEFEEKHAIAPKWTQRNIGKAKLNKSVRQLILPAPAGFQKNWQVYRQRFVNEQRVSAGIQFWNRNESTLQRAQNQFGIPASLIVGVLGVETIYGKDIGKFNVLDALCTLAFEFPATHPRALERQTYFKMELEQFLLMAYRSRTDPLAYKGSYAGAMGWPQFMPSSWVRYAIDYDNDGRTDLFHSEPDMIGSIANYFQQYGWKSGEPTHFPATLAPTQDSDQLSRLLTPDILPTFTAQEMSALGVQLDPLATHHSGKLALVELKNGSNPPEYLAGTDNFYVVTRYNWSAYYATAVIELGLSIAHARAGQAPEPTPHQIK